MPGWSAGGMAKATEDAWSRNDRMLVREKSFIAPILAGGSDNGKGWAVSIHQDIRALAMFAPSKQVRLRICASGGEALRAWCVGPLTKTAKLHRIHQCQGPNRRATPEADVAVPSSTTVHRTLNGLSMPMGIARTDSAVARKPRIIISFATKPLHSASSLAFAALVSSLRCIDNLALMMVRRRHQCWVTNKPTVEGKQKFLFYENSQQHERGL
ncbi:uncharacterized protein EI90DRAFT_3289778 [Cantharellus anzutake]|uniref:uncharacterized protein n=1 Tax=Cantharellus anzutake TaxID=1750568 RepID=UPI001907FC53|nr:uncharacterized protein EI90DRAFT_3289778 [Cantharellus anzutake]KAF8330306.1 hypothetical protein EI90DRAFT_3289778 [Cantharellus anzutake]